MAYNEKERLKIWRQINKDYATGKYSITSCCKAQGISFNTFKKWDGELNEKLNEQPKTETKSETAEISYEDARASRREVYKGKLKELAETALEYHLKLQEYEERKKAGKVGANGVLKVEKIEVTQKRKDPNPMLIRFTLENTDPENFRTKQTIEHQGENPFIALMKAAAANNQNSK